ncbi:response regulator [Paenibacillus rhizovicinus]|uniref:Response regulator n=1 Tax=Paenibacillus rhizovicinus TaxID=2704463 RepID=A0A6C0P4E3_9BACL|nr:response regulator [Paenibacillus rhizovicinus]QHW33315.1 response regulator [Paenibacillus rhizovicinus]
MYEVLIVDDEPLARQSLQYLIDWKAFGFKITGEAEDGKQALELMRQRHFSLVLTDIRMPTMNGLEFIEKLRGVSDAEVVILSGYEDFEYARQGLKLGVNDYLLKPVDEDDLIAALRRIGASIAERQLLRRQRDLGLTALRDQFLRRLAHGPLSSPELEEQFRLLNLRNEAERLHCLVVEMDFLSADDGKLTERDIELKSFAVRNVLEEMCDGKGYVFEDTEERYGLLLFGTGGLNARNDDMPVKLAEEIGAAVRVNVKETVSIGVGQAAGDLRGVHQAYDSAEKALDAKFLRGKGSILTATNADGGEAESPELHALQEAVYEAIRNQREGEVKEALGRLWECCKSSGLGGNRIRAAVLEMLVQLLQLATSYGANSELLFHHDYGDYDRVMRTKTIDELFAFVDMKCVGVLLLLNRLKDMQPNSVIGTVKRIVQEQYHSNVSLRTVAGQVFLNPNYLGKLFKAGTDSSFNEYLLQVRMEKAKELLLRTDKKVYEIALAVGYGELDWFYKRFKSYAGISAGEFRGKYAKESESN